MVHKALAAGLLVLGLLQSAGHLLRHEWLEAVGALTVASPLPLVFTDRDGLEDFASEFRLRYLVTGATWVEVKVSAQHFARLHGPFNRRGAYAAAFAYAPRMPEESWQAIFSYGFCRTNELLATLGEKRPIERLELLVRTRTRGRNHQWRFPLQCP